MGSAIADHLIPQEYDVVGYDISDDRLDEFARHGGRPAASIGELATYAPVVITSLPTDAAFQSVIAEIWSAASPGLVVADTSTLSSEIKKYGRDLLAKQSVTLLDCPLSGTGAQARAGDLVALMSGPVEQVEAIKPVFRAFCRHSSYVGEFGRGTDIKLIANLLVAIHTVAAAEALVLAERIGLDLYKVIETLTDSAAGSRMLEVRGPVMAAREWQLPNMRLDMFMKDLRLIGALAERVNSPTPLFWTAVKQYRAAQEQGLGEYDTACVVESIRRSGEQS